MTFDVLALNDAEAGGNGLPGMERLAATEDCVRSFALGGVAFELLAEAGQGASLGDCGEFAVPMAEVGTGAVVGEVRCALAVEPALMESPEGREIRWEWRQDRGSVRTMRVRAELRRLSPGRYAATARLGAGPEAKSLAAALSSAVVSREGGLSLHAAAAELGGAAVLFVGPSGAGKTTARDLVLAGRRFSRDRVTVFPAAGCGWMAWAMPGGSPVIEPMPAAAHVALPLACVLRVHQGSAVELRRAEGAEAMALVRESVMCGGTTAADELERLAAIERLVSEVPVGVVTTVLGVDLSARLCDWVGEGA